MAVPDTATEHDLRHLQPAPREGYRARFAHGWPLLRVMTKRDYRARYRQSLLDVGWSLVTPIAILIVYGFIFTVAFNVDGEGAPYLSFVWTGLVVWTLFSTGLGTGASSLLMNSDLVSKIYFPREVLPLSAVGSSVIDFAISFVVLCVLVLVQIGSVSITVLGAIPAFGLALLWTAAIAVFTAAITVFIRDMAQVVMLFLRVAILATPVMYGPGVLPDSVQFLATWNPIAVAIGGARDAILYQVWPNWGALALHAAAGIATFAFAIAYMRSVEGRMNDVI